MCTLLPCDAWILWRESGSGRAHGHNAMAIAEFLTQQPHVKAIRYPGLPNDPSHAIAKQQMHHFGFIISFDLGSQTMADKFLANTQLIYQATSFGGMHTMAERRARWGTDDVSQGLIRLSVGCENKQDLLQDIQQALSSLNDKN